jgi:hypothetical protein
VDVLSVQPNLDSFRNSCWTTGGEKGQSFRYEELQGTPPQRTPGEEIIE